MKGKMFPENLWGKITPIIEKKTSAYSSHKVNISILDINRAKPHIPPRRKNKPPNPQKPPQKIRVPWVLLIT